MVYSPPGRQTRRGAGRHGACRGYGPRNSCDVIARLVRSFVTCASHRERLNVQVVFTVKVPVADRVRAAGAYTGGPPGSAGDQVVGGSRESATPVVPLDT